MNTTQILSVEFVNLAIEELIETGAEVTLQTHYHTLQEWCEIYEEVPPRNRAETAVQDAMIMARDHVKILLDLHFLQTV